MTNKNLHIFLGADGGYAVYLTVGESSDPPGKSLREAMELNLEQIKTQIENKIPINFHFVPSVKDLQLNSENNV